MKSVWFRCSLALIVGSLALMSNAQEPPVPANSDSANSVSANSVSTNSVSTNSVSTNIGTPRGETATGAGVEAKAPRAISTRRLPKYFASVVDTKQRMAIYEIQLQYREKFEQLERQMADLRLAEMDEVEKVLTATQRVRIEELRLEAASRTKEVPSLKGESSPVTEGATGGSPPESSGT